MNKMPIVTIKTFRGAMSKEKKKELHKRMTDLLVEVEGNGNKEFRKLVTINIEENDPENFSNAGIQAPDNFVDRMINRND